MKSAFIYESDFVVKLTLELKILRDEFLRDDRRGGGNVGEVQEGPVDLEGRDREKCAAY